MRIAIIGAQGVGKTTLANQIIEAYPDFKLLPEAARLAQELGFKLDEQADLKTEIWITTKQLELESQEGSWVADRCFIDLTIYLDHLFSSKQEFDDLRNQVRNLAHQQARKYDLIVYLPTKEFPLISDGVRNIDLLFQEAIDQKFVKWLAKAELPHVVIRGDPTQRLAQTKNLIDKHLKGKRR